ncbi:short chain dehydrogenase [uncultured Aquimarina sp.]|uniref:short chain dehydrogenase n=1 Tax=uncultured Aquimarina sp. TaxID=575652 RepID=UPI0026075E05|nr:short chain dehydrogenase [uncultured Aquimarina sp.]
MKILIIGSTGTIGKSIYESLQEHHQVYGAHRNSPSYPIDITNQESIRQLFEKLPKLDAVINAAGTASWKSLYDLKEEDYYLGIKSKLMGQVNLVHIAKDYMNDHGSITLTTGILAEHYEPNAVALSLINGAIHSFVNAASKELNRGIRLNTVAPGAISGDFPKDKKFAGYFPVEIEDVVKIYEYSLNTTNSGQILKIY